ncbi:hypothetical protein B9Z55_020830 [Caenorhabditis nigoni]|uniref:Uncharacterized protein n=1 Tax=Caenorhabditis nigoni TaxID=1611254 RepID=A0A2G5TPH4_9PELO|nr:hypothetical protein B9Z55_020830 [Caenorhabditis nigoni]
MNSFNFSSAFVNYNQLDDWRSLAKLLGTPFDDFVEFGAPRRRWFYRIPENDQEALCVHFRRFSIFHFERIALCLVPKNGFEGEFHHSNL